MKGDDMYKRIHFTGGGRITRILLEGLKRKNALPEFITVCDPDPKTHHSIQELNITGLEVKEKNSAETSADLVFLAVHPPVVKEVMPEILKNLHSQSILISLMPVIKISTLKQFASGFDRIVRMIPNAPSIIGKGYNPVFVAESISSQEKSSLNTFLNNWGQTPEVEENKLEAYAILTAMGPTYFWFQWLELQRLGREFGLDDVEIKSSLHEMLVASSQLLFNSDYSADEILDMIPVRPLKEEEEKVRMIYYSRLSELYFKLTKK
jgi:pyrroline-5-carboxylate reductase